MFFSAKSKAFFASARTSPADTACCAAGTARAQGANAPSNAIVAILTIVDRSPVDATRRSQKSAFSPQSIVWARALPTARAGFPRGIEKSLGNTLFLSDRLQCAAFFAWVHEFAPGTWDRNSAGTKRTKNSSQNPTMPCSPEWYDFPMQTAQTFRKRQMPPRLILHE
jgi:hypothetical protein